MARLKVTGLRETVRKLEKFGVATGDLKDSMQRIGTIVSNEIQSLVPVKTGALRASVRPSRAKNKAIVRAGGARTAYAVYQDKGYKGIRGRYFMERGLEAKQQEVIRSLETELEGLIRQYDL